MDATMHKLLSFLALNDTPDSYIGKSGMFIKVKVTEDGLEFGVGGGGSGGHTIQEEGSSLTARTYLDFIGAGFTATDDAGNDKTKVTLDATLNSLAALGTAANKLAYTTGIDTWAEADITAAGRAILDDATAADQRTTLGLGTVATLASDTDGTLAANSDARVATQKAVKTYVDTAVTGLLDFKGSTDCSANPNYPAASKGDAYIVTVAGKIGGASGKSVEVGDVYLAIADNAGGTEAAVGTSWTVLEHNLVGALLSANNLSDVANTTTARSNLGLAIGTDVQAYDATLASIAALGTAADKIAYTTALDTWAETALTAFARTILDDADASTARATLGAAASGANSDITALSGLTGAIAKPTSITMAAGGVLRTDVNAADTLLLQAYDVDGATYVTFATLTANNSPTFNLSTSCTIGSTAFYRASGSDVALADGGTGASLVDPNADRFLFWDDSAGAMAFLTPGNGLTITTTTVDIDSASTTVDGIVELATTAEINTGTDSTRAMPVDQFVASNRNVRYVTLRFIPNANDWEADGTTKVGGDWVCPFTGTIVDIEGDVDTAGTTGTSVVDVNLNGSTIMTTNKLKWDSTEKSTRNYSGTAPGLTTTAVTAGDIFTADIDTNHTTKSKGLTVFLAIRLT